MADKRKKKTVNKKKVSGDKKCAPGQEGLTPNLHREGLSCAAVVLCTCGSCNGERTLWRKPSYGTTKLQI